MGEGIKMTRRQDETQIEGLLPMGITPLVSSSFGQLIANTPGDING
jgi:hypothetical protein